MGDFLSARSDPNFIRKSITFTGAAGLGAVGTVTVFTVTGHIEVVRIVPVCTTDLGVDGGTGAASLSLGVTSATTAFVAATVATAIDANEIWMSTTPPATFLAIPAAMKEIAMTGNILGEVTSTGTQLVNSGVIRFELYWRPLSANAAVT